MCTFMKVWRVCRRRRSDFTSTSVLLWRHRCTRWQLNCQQRVKVLRMYTKRSKWEMSKGNQAICNIRSKKKRHHLLITLSPKDPQIRRSPWSLMLLLTTENVTVWASTAELKILFFLSSVPVWGLVPYFDPMQRQITRFSSCISVLTIKNVCHINCKLVNAAHAALLLHTLHIQHLNFTAA